LWPMQNLAGSVILFPADFMEMLICQNGKFIKALTSDIYNL